MLVSPETLTAGFDLALPTQELHDRIELQREYRAPGGGSAVTQAALGSQLEVHLKVRSLGGELSDVAVLHRLEKAADWLGGVVVGFLRERGLTHRVPGLSVQVVDATAISRPGSKGTDWRVHVSLDLAEEWITGVEVTDVRGGETLDRHEVKPGQVVLDYAAYLTELARLDPGTAICAGGKPGPRRPVAHSLRARSGREH